MTPFDDENLAKFREVYPLKGGKFRHQVASPLLTNARLAELARFLPEKKLEYNRAAGIPVAIHPDDVERNGLSAAETIERINECASWIVLKNVELDPEYAALANGIRNAVSKVIVPATGKLTEPESFIFVSSDMATTPCHLDPEHNILFQIEGEKEMCIFPPEDREIVAQTRIENFYAGGHRNVVFDEKLADRGTIFTLKPGDAVHVPYLAPHWVRVTKGPSISLSVTWRSRMVTRSRFLHRINNKLRGMGANPVEPGKVPALDAAKVAGGWAVEGVRWLRGGGRAA